MVAGFAQAMMPWPWSIGLRKGALLACDHGEAAAKRWRDSCGKDGAAGQGRLQARAGIGKQKGAGLPWRPRWKDSLDLPCFLVFQMRPAPRDHFENRPQHEQSQHKNNPGRDDTRSDGKSGLDSGMPKDEQG